MGHFERYVNINPIELTEKWLIRFGFKPTQVHDKLFEYVKDGIAIHTERTIYEMKVSSVYKTLDVPLKSVHQLQNLFYAITSQELIAQE